MYSVSSSSPFGSRRAPHNSHPNNKENVYLKGTNEIYIYKTKTRPTAPVIAINPAWDFPAPFASVFFPSKRQLSKVIWISCCWEWNLVSDETMPRTRKRDIGLKLNISIIFFNYVIYTYLTMEKSQIGKEAIYIGRCSKDTTRPIHYQRYLVNIR